MNYRLKSLALLSAVFAFVAIQAKADTIVYDNGPVNGTINAWTINNGYSVSDSFTVAGDTGLTMATVGLWTYGGNPVSVAWSIGTSAFGSEISSGVSTFSNSYLGNASWGYSLFDSTFAISGSVSSGTYYLTLSDASSTDQNFVYWDQNDGPSTAQQTYTGTLPGSNSFKIQGGNSVPDSGATLALFGAAMLSLVAVRRRFAA